MSVELTHTVRVRNSTPSIPLRYFSFKIEGSLEIQYGFSHETDDINMSVGTVETYSPTGVSTETTATVGAEVYSACEDSIRISIEEKLGGLFDYITGGAEDKTPEQVIAEVTSVNIRWRGARGGEFEHTSVVAEIAPFGAFIEDATFINIAVELRFEQSLIQVRSSRIGVTGGYTASVPVAVTRAGIVRISSMFYRGAIRAAQTTMRVGSWISRAFAASGATGEALLIGGVVAGGALAGGAAATGFCMWLLDRAHRTGSARGLTNQMASGFVRYLFDRDNIFANLVERRGSLYSARVRGGNMAYRDVRATSEAYVKDTWKVRLFPDQPRLVKDSYVRANIGDAIYRMMVILDASGLGYDADDIIRT